MKTASLNLKQEKHVRVHVLKDMRKEQLQHQMAVKKNLACQFVLKDLLEEQMVFVSKAVLLD